MLPSVLRRFPYSSPGRLNYDSLSQQTMMEMVIAGTFNKEAICRDLNEPKVIDD